MLKQLRFLEFEVAESGDDILTLEAMASVAPDQQAPVLAEVAKVLVHLHRLTANGPHPLDDGGDWDAWLQWQADHLPAIALALPTGAAETAAGSSKIDVPATPQGTQWVCITLTLALSPVVADRLGSALR